MSVLISPSRRVAVINEERVQVGDFVSGAEILEIHPREVVLRIAGEAVSIGLIGRSVKDTIELQE